MFWPLDKLPRKRKPKPAYGDAVNVSRLPGARATEPEWKRVLLDSLRRNNLAPSGDVILHSFDLFDDQLNEPGRKRGGVIAELFADILSDVALLRGLVPDLIEQTIAHSPYAFSQVMHQTELR